ncbi:MAG: hypothetical protein IKV87_03175 [Methanobrevibacter sp.]|nr:hypothetical protein [Methanobrevibacter sp.]
MNIKESHQFQLYLLTLKIFILKEQILPENCDNWCINATIINRAYYSSYLYCELWLEKVKKFKPKPPWKFKKSKKRIGEHKQVRDALYNFGEEEVEQELRNLAYLRKKADYNPYSNITAEELEDAIGHMKKIFSQLEFQ